MRNRAVFARTTGALLTAICLLSSGCASHYGRTIASVHDEPVVDHRTRCDLVHRDVTIRSTSPHLRHTCDLRGFRGPGADIF